MVNLSEETFLVMMDKLCERLMNGETQDCDTACRAMRAITPKLITRYVAQSVLASLCPQLVKGITAAVSTNASSLIILVKYIRECKS